MHSSESRGEKKNAEFDVSRDDDNNNLSCLGNRDGCTPGPQNSGGAACDCERGERPGA